MKIGKIFILAVLCLSLIGCSNDDKTTNKPVDDKKDEEVKTNTDDKNTNNLVEIDYDAMLQDFTNKGFSIKIEKIEDNQQIIDIQRGTSNRGDFSKDFIRIGASFVDDKHHSSTIDVYADTEQNHKYYPYLVENHQIKKEMSEESSNKLAETLKEINYSEAQLLTFFQTYYDLNKVK